MYCFFLTDQKTFLTSRQSGFKMSWKILLAHLLTLLRLHVTRIACNCLCFCVCMKLKNYAITILVYFVLACNAKSSTIAILVFFMFFVSSHFPFRRCFWMEMQMVLYVVCVSCCCRHMWPISKVLHWTHWQIDVSTSWNLVCVTMTCHVHQK